MGAEGVLLPANGVQSAGATGMSGSMEGEKGSLGS